MERAMKYDHIYTLLAGVMGLFIGIMLPIDDNGSDVLLHQVCHDYEVQKAVYQAMKHMDPEWQKQYLPNQGCEEYRQIIREKYIDTRE